MARTVQVTGIYQVGARWRGDTTVDSAYCQPTFWPTQPTAQQVEAYMTQWLAAQDAEAATEDALESLVGVDL
jgi:hypothetical protein